MIDDLVKENRQVCNALAKVGIVVDSIYDLVNTSAPYPEAIPVLLEWLPKINNPRIKEGVARALTLRDAGHEVAIALISEFKNYHVDSPQKESVKWAMGNAISVAAADKSLLDEIIALVRDKRHSRARQMLAHGLWRFKDKRAVDTLIEVLDDSDIQGHVLYALGRLKVECARPLIEPFLEHENSYIRKEAKTALARIDKASKKSK